LLGNLLETEQACADAVEALMPQAVPEIRVPIVYVSAQVDGKGGTFNKSLAVKVIDGLNAAYARAGFAFNLTSHYMYAFDNLNDVDASSGSGDQCHLDKPEAGCLRCAAYKQADQALQNPNTLFIYGTSPESKCDRG
jgi:hypothetical protein